MYNGKALSKHTNISHNINKKKKTNSLRRKDLPVEMSVF
jgi:hypothetical protein